MKCQNTKCGQKHSGTFGSGKFCSRSCANSREKTETTKRKTAESMRLAFREGRAKQPTVDFEKILAKRKQQRQRELIEADFSSLSFGRLRNRLILEQDSQCNRCGLNEWCGEQIALELEHKDGNNRNNTRENLEMLCPNCHSLTKTWRGRNKTPLRKERISEEGMVKAYLTTNNMRQALLSLGLAAKGANYARLKRVLTLWNIEY